MFNKKKEAKIRKEQKINKLNDTLEDVRFLINWAYKEGRYDEETKTLLSGWLHTIEYASEKVVEEVL